MIKQIEINGYNQAEILKVYEDGSCVCTVSQVVDGVIVRQDTNIVLNNGVHFELTEQELLILNPEQMKTYTHPEDLPEEGGTPPTTPLPPKPIKRER